MARMTKESLEAKIKKAEERVVNEALVEAFMKSNKTLEEAIAFFESDMKSDDGKEKPKRRGGRRRKTTE